MRIHSDSMHSLHLRFVFSFPKNEALKLFSALTYDWERISILILIYQYIDVVSSQKWNVKTFPSFDIWLEEDIDISSVLNSLGTDTPNICLCQQNTSWFCIICPTAKTYSKSKKSKTLNVNLNVLLLNICIYRAWVLH